MENFKLLHSVLIYDTIPVHKYVSSRTGLTVVIAETDGPLISTRFCIATEVLGDDAFPNVLRELIFLGSEEYPQDLQSLISNRCLVSEINPWIANEHSSYTVEAVAEEDLLTVLSIVAEYILYPLLREDDYKIKIHHVTEDGKHAGEMHDELEDLEPFPTQLPYSILLKAIYSKRFCHTSLTKHTAKKLRESITLAKVRDYHKEFYRPENLNIIIAGSVKPEAVFQALKKLEEKIISKGDRDPFQRPFQRLAPPLTEDVKELVIRYPEDQAASGQFYIAWRTVSCIKESYTLRAISMLLEYLTWPPEKPVVKEFIKNEDTFASSVYHDVTENAESCMYFTFNGVPVEKLPTMRAKLQSVLKNIFENKDINMKSMEAIITKNKLQSLISAESYSGSNVLNVVVPYVIHGSNEDFQHIANPFSEMNDLLREPQSFWLSLLKKYFIDNKCVALQIVPSSEEKMDTGKGEDDTTNTLIEKVAQVDLKERGDVVDAAQCNKEKLPQNPIVAVPIPNLDSIKFYNIERYTSDSDVNRRIDLSQTPVFTYFDHVKTSTVFMQVLLDTSKVPVALQYYLPLFVESLMELPIERDGVIIPHDVVEKQLGAETVYKWADTRCYNMPYLAFVTVEVENAKFETGLRWLRELLYRTVFTADRLKDIIMKQDNYLSEPCGSTNVYDAIYKMCFPKDSSVVIGSHLEQHKFLKQLMEKLDNGDSKEVLDSMELIRSIITEPSKMYLHIVGNLDDLKNPVEAINRFLPPEVKITEKRQKLSPVFSYNLLEFKNSSRGCIIGVEGTDSNSFYQVMKCIISYVDPDYPALCLYTKYLEQIEDSVHKRFGRILIRFNIEVEEGLLYLNYHRKSPDLVEIYKRIKENVTGLLKDRGWDQSLLESARRSLLYSIIEDESSVLDLTLLSRNAFLHDLDYMYHRKLFDLIKNVTSEDLHRVGERYIAPLFDPENTRMAIVTHSSCLAKTAEEFKGLGFDLTVYTSVEDIFLNEL